LYSEINKDVPPSIMDQIPWS